ncbi:MAG TPA: 4-hydroxyphenylacetate 3-monooxygenase, oxygenase component [Candidatus Eisenbacteria bacterium]|nr:4-hydroxyphenylacetate 3-monooxygenase, oxygenase component [Candidatus Eisenbacteria bacterium]
MPARTGAEYLAGLEGGREIWFAGERVRNVVEHPILGRTARSIAELYDLQWNPQFKSKLTYPSPATGDPVSLAFIQPRSVDDLVRRRAMFKAWADWSGGLLGRTPDYLNAILAGFACSSAYFGRNGSHYAERIVAYYQGCRERDLCATHAFVDPQINRARSQSEQADPTVPLHIESESREGLIVSGARMLATLAPFADELHVFPSPSRTQPSDAPRFAFAFAVPVSTPGLRFICRESFDAGGPMADYPLTAQYEEMDAVAIFHRVVVPWDRVFLKGDISLCNRLFRDTPAFLHGIHQFTAKNLAKAEFVLGVASLLAETIGRSELPLYQQLLGEIVDVVETERAYLRAAEADAITDESGFVHPNPDILATARNYFPRIYPRLIEILQLIGSSGLMATPTERDLAAPAISADIERYYQSATLTGKERVRLFRLAWDLACSSFGGRQVLYERFFAGDPFLLMASRFTNYDRSAAVARVKAFLERADAELRGKH